MCLQRSGYIVSRAEDSQTVRLLGNCTAKATLKYGNYVCVFDDRQNQYKTKLAEKVEYIFLQDSLHLGALIISIFYRTLSMSWNIFYLVNNNFFLLCTCECVCDNKLN